MKAAIVTALLLLISVGLFAQRGGNIDPSRRVKAEKDSVYARINDLSIDQKQILESIYADYEVSVKGVVDSRDEDRSAFREKLQTVAQEKNQLIKEVLNDEQWKVFTTMQEEERQKRQNRRQNRGGGNRRGRQG